jgi:putative addiction module component (TIGR02574 family)
MVRFTEVILSPRLSHLENEALQLPSEERALLADHLIASLHPDPAVDDAWGAEVERRLQAIEDGSEALAPIDDALERVRRSLA